MTKKSLTTKDILQKEFKKGMRGYDATEVDEFLDLVIRDYESYNKDLTILREENERLLKQVNALTEELVSSQKSSTRCACCWRHQFRHFETYFKLRKTCVRCSFERSRLIHLCKFRITAVA